MLQVSPLSFFVLSSLPLSHSLCYIDVTELGVAVLSMPVISTCILIFICGYRLGCSSRWFGDNLSGGICNVFHFSDSC